MRILILLYFLVKGDYLLCQLIKNDAKLDLSEKGRQKDGTVISSDKRMFMQFMAFGDCWNTERNNNKI